MKVYLWVFFAVIICGVQYGFAQDTTPVKGYYSIPGKNNQRAAVQTPVVLQSKLDRFPTVTKGYYSINGHNRKLPRKTIIFQESARPVAPKGYYSMPVPTDSLDRKKQK